MSQLFVFCIFDATNNSF